MKIFKGMDKGLNGFDTFLELNFVHLTLTVVFTLFFWLYETSTSTKSNVF